MIRIFNGTDFLESVEMATTNNDALRELAKELDETYGPNCWTDIEVNNVRTPRSNLVA